MIASFDYYNRFEQPIISLRSPSNEFMGFVPNVKNLNINPEFNAVSEMSCDVYKYNNTGGDVDEAIEQKLLKVYDDIQIKRQLFVEGVGYFIITEVSDNDDEEEGEYKSLSLLSCEHEISYKKLTYFNGTYKFWDEDAPSETLMGQILHSLPRWSIGHVDESIMALYRTFEEPDTTIYSFLMDDVQDSYGCLFDFDIINRIINVYDKNNYIHKTTILLSRNDVISNISIATRSEEVYTALSLFGDDEITYSGINPIGGSTVYNFEHYKSWMSQGLQDALTAWENNIAKAEVNIASLRTELNNKRQELQNDYQAILNSLDEQIINAEKDLGVCISADPPRPEMVEETNAKIKTLQAQRVEAQARYDAKNAEIEELNSQFSTIYESCSFNNNFTDEQMMELDAYIFEATEVDDTFAFTEDMDYEEQEGILVGLYNKAKEMIKDIATPVEELSLDTNNFVFQKEFLPYAEQLETGVIIDIVMSDESIVSYVLLRMDVNYEDKTISLTLGNKYRSSNAESLWSDWQSNVSHAATTLNYERAKYGKAVNSGSLDKMDIFMNSSLNLTLNQVKASDGQSFVMTDSGLKGRRINPDTGEVDDEQIWLTSNNIVFTDDAWDTIKTAIGKVVLPDGSTGYGINAEYIIGKWIIGQNLEISNTSGSFVINEDGIVSKYYDSEIGEAKTLAQQASDKFSWIVSGESETDLTLTDTMASLTADAISLNGDVQVSGEMIVDGAITAEKLNTDAIKSLNYVADTSGSFLNLADGTFDSKYFKLDSEGKITATSGTIGNWDILQYTIRQDHVAEDGNTYRVSIANYDNDNADSRVFHTTTITADGTETDVFSVRRNGQVRCSDILATGGTVGGWTLSNGKLSATSASGLVATLQAPSDNITWVLGVGGTSHTDYSDCPFRVNKDGELYATGATISGVLTAGSGSKIGNWNVTNSSIYNGSSTFGDSSGMYFGSSGLSLGSTFQVTSGGECTASNINITGGSLSIGGVDDTFHAIVSSSGCKFGMIYCKGIAAYDGTGGFRFKTNGDTELYNNLIPLYNMRQSLGDSTHTWAQVYVQGGVVETSDYNQKKDIVLCSDNYSDIIDDLDVVTYKFIKNTSDRTHVGIIAQQVEQAVLDKNMTTQDFAGVCIDTDEDGNSTYAVRYGEISMLHLANYKRYKAKTDERIDTLENELKKLKEKLNEV